MAVQIPGFTTDSSFPFWYLRKMMGSLATAGVVNPSTDFIVSPSSGLQVQVTSGAAFVQQTVNVEGSSAYNGLYWILNDATANPVNTITAPVSNPRIDLVILRAYDVNEQGLGGSSKGQIEWVQGSENASASLATMGPGLSNPGIGTVPTNSMILAYVLQTVGEASISASNILDARPRTHGFSNVSTSQSTSSTTYTTLATPDQVSGIVLPTNGLIRVWYWATWQQSVASTARAAIFLGSNQIEATVGSAGDLSTQEASPGTDTTNNSLSSSPAGLISGAGQARLPDVTTGQVVGVFPGTTICYIGGVQVNGLPGGACDLFAAAGTYTISVRFKTSSGTVTVKNRQLWVQAIPFS